MLKLGFKFLSREEIRYFEKWIPIAILIGIISGIGAILFYWSIHLMTFVFLEQLSGYKPPVPGSEEQPIFELPQNPYMLPIITMIGGLISGFIVFKWAPEAEGHGTDAAIEAFHYKDGEIRNRVPLIKLVASALTIGSGGSAGKEGPIAQIGAGFGSLLGKTLNLSPRERRIAVAVGIGAGIGSIFKAPFGGALLASEILYLRDFEPEVLPPAFIATMIGYLIFGYFNCWKPIFYTPSFRGEQYIFHDPLSLLLFSILGVLCGVFGVIYVKTFYGIKALFDKLKIPRIFKPAIGGFLVGLIGMYYPYILESGYGWLQMLIQGNMDILPITIIILLPFLKIIATSLSISSGGSGGVFAPSLFIGGTLGTLTWYLSKILFPGYNVDPSPFVIIGMMAFFSGVGKVPVSVILMVSEMTGTYKLFVPSLVATTISYVLTGNCSIYINQLLNREESPAHEFSKVSLLRRIYQSLIEKRSDMLTKVKAKDIMVKPIAVLRLDDNLDKAIKLFDKYHYRVFPIVNQEYKFMGFIEIQDIIPIIHRNPDTKLEYMNIRKGLSFYVDSPVREIIEKMIEYEKDKVAVTDYDNHLVGIITVKEIMSKVYLIKK